MKKLDIIRNPHSCKGIGHWYCSECETLIENYEKAKADNFKGWELHHRLETRTSDEEKRLVELTPEELKEKGLYYRRPAKELIYMTKEGHDEHHNKNKRRYCQCIETGEVHYVNEWRRLGFPLAGDVANGKYVSHHNLHFVWV